MDSRFGPGERNCRKTCGGNDDVPDQTHGMNRKVNMMRFLKKICLVLFEIFVKLQHNFFLDTVFKK